MDFVSLAVLSTLTVNDYNSETNKEKCIGTVSLSALLKASQRLSSMTDITGTICVTKGKFFSRKNREDLEGSGEECKGETEWRQEGLTSELTISLNMVLSMYVLQVYAQDKASPSNVLHMGRKETQVKRTFYINYDLLFRYVDAASVELSKVCQPAQNELPVSSDLMKSMKNFVFYWRHTVDPENLVRLLLSIGSGFRR
eukprot:TRINITY_DN13389_c0_g1_i1.p1 TRINITY_DN13389_c0_g1~~TRINITY_DN13389_c0_g1_i1.p1  ORF type:complete len:199 (-),score=52.94 TRINITY_DN13389_c0_g1_i1:316-912(-)